MWQTNLTHILRWISKLQLNPQSGSPAILRLLMKTFTLAVSQKVSYFGLQVWSNVNVHNSLCRYRWRRFDHPWWNHILLYKSKIGLVRQFLCPCIESPAAVFFLLDEIPSLKSAESVLLYVVTLPWLHWNGLSLSSELLNRRFGP